MRPVDPADQLLVGIACATAALLALTEQYSSLVAAAAAYALGWWLVRPPGAAGRHLPFR